MIHSFVRSESQLAALRSICETWAHGPEAFWSYEMVMAAVERPGAMAYFIAPSSDAPWRACLFADVGPYTADLLYVYVCQEHRREGLAYALLSKLVEELEKKPHLEALMLEVRASNLAAQALYENMGMQRLNTRKRYYRDGEDAYVYRLDLDS